MNIYEHSIRELLSQSSHTDIKTRDITLSASSYQELLSRLHQMGEEFNKHFADARVLPGEIASLTAERDKFRTLLHEANKVKSALRSELNRLKAKPPCS